MNLKLITLLDILNQYAKTDNRIHIIAKSKNEGQAKSKNLGIDKACAEYVVFIDPDDYYPEERTLEKLYKAVCQNNVYIAGGNLIKLTPEGEHMETRFTHNGICLFKDDPFSYGFTLFIYNRKFLVKNKIRFPNNLRFEDPPFLVRAMIFAKKYYALTDPVYVYRVNHKKVHWTERKVLDVLNGLSDILSISQQHKLNSLYVNQIKILWSELSEAYQQVSSPSVRESITDIFENIDENILAHNLGKKLVYQDFYCDLIKRNKQLYKKWKPYIKWPLLPTTVYYKKKYDNGHREVFLFGRCVLSYHKNKKTPKGKCIQGTLIKGEK